MFALKMHVGHYYTITLAGQRMVVCAVLYGFERGKNKDVYTLRIFDGTRDFEFPVMESTFDRWVRDGCVKEISAEDAFAMILKGPSS